MQTKRQETVDWITRERISAIIRTQDQGLAESAISAAIEGGFRIVEFTLTTPGALELVKKFAGQRDLLVGAGTVMTTDAARAAVQAGASFLVSPICDAVLLAEAARLDVACIPGAFTPTEMETAHRLGADFVKIFPAPPGGVDYIQAIRAPLPHLKLFPTAGVTAENLGDYLRAGCAGAGFVKALFDPSFMAGKNFVAIRERAKSIVQQLRAFTEMQKSH